MLNKLRKKVNSNKGFSLLELLACTVIMLLATSVLTATMAIATRHYNNSVLTSEANMLNKTISMSIRDRLSNVVKYNDKEPYGSGSNAASKADYLYYSTSAGELYYPFRVVIRNEEGAYVSATEANKGEVVLDYYYTEGKITHYRLINSNAYADYGKALQLSCVIEPDEETENGRTKINFFNVNIKVFDKEDNELSESSFIVYPTSGSVRNVND